VPAGEGSSGSPALNPVAGRSALQLGLGAIALWSLAIGLLRGVLEDFGTLGGAALIYTIGSVVLLCCFGRPPPLCAFGRGYLCAGALLLAGYEICLALALGLAEDARQAMEMALVNYLWPCFTVLLAVCINGQRVRWALLLPGAGLALAGNMLAIDGGSLSLQGLAHNIAANPPGYALALAGAVLWPLYTNVTRRHAQGVNGIAYFFAVTAAVLWLLFLAVGSPMKPADARKYLELLAAGVVMGAGYGLWNLASLRGDVARLGAVANLTPVLSALFAAAWLGAVLPASFWTGAVLVSGGALLCYHAAR
jgi:drug/metabolite transporter (DMT)-like permease